MDGEEAQAAQGDGSMVGEGVAPVLDPSTGGLDLEPATGLGQRTPEGGAELADKAIQLEQGFDPETGEPLEDEGGQQQQQQQQGGDEGDEGEEDFIVQGIDLGDGNAQDFSMTEITDALAMRQGYEANMAQAQVEAQRYQQVVQQLGADSEPYAQAAQLVKELKEFIESDVAVEEPDLAMLDGTEEGRQRYVEAQQRYKASEASRKKARELIARNESQASRRSEAIKEQMSEAIKPERQRRWPELFDKANEGDIDAFMEYYGINADDIMGVTDPKLLSIMSDAYRYRTNLSKGRKAGARARAKDAPKIVRGKVGSKKSGGRKAGADTRRSYVREGGGADHFRAAGAELERYV